MAHVGFQGALLELLPSFVFGAINLERLDTVSQMADQVDESPVYHPRLVDREMKPTNGRQFSSLQPVDYLASSTSPTPGPRLS